MRIQSRPSRLHLVVKQNEPQDTVYFYIAAVHQRHPLRMPSIVQSMVTRNRANLEDCVADTFPTLTAA